MQVIFLNSLRADVDDLARHVSRQNPSIAARPLSSALTKNKPVSGWKLSNSVRSLSKEALSTLTSMSAPVSHRAPIRKLPFTPTRLESYGSPTLAGEERCCPTGGSRPPPPPFTVTGISGLAGDSYKGR